jgi:hypothetical protein
MCKPLKATELLAQAIPATKYRSEEKSDASNGS